MRVFVNILWSTMAYLFQWIFFNGFFFSRSSIFIFFFIARTILFYGFSYIGFLGLACKSTTLSHFTYMRAHTHTHTNTHAHIVGPCYPNMCSKYRPRTNQKHYFFFSILFLKFYVYDFTVTGLLSCDFDFHFHRLYYWSVCWLLSYILGREFCFCFGSSRDYFLSLSSTVCVCLSFIYIIYFDIYNKTFGNVVVRRRQENMLKVSLDPCWKAKKIRWTIQSDSFWMAKKIR